MKRQMISENSRKRKLVLTDDEDDCTGKTCKFRPVMRSHDEGGDTEKMFRFKILLPNGMSVELTLRDPEPELPFVDFITLVKDKYKEARKHFESMKKKRDINWKDGNLFLLDADDTKIRNFIKLKNYKPNKCHILRLHDGCIVAKSFQNMWDLTPDTDLLLELPEEYTFETALADLIDNSLQAVWSIKENHRRIVSINLVQDKISIFDNGPGMDDTDENSLVKWGKMGASLNRSFKSQAIGGKPPYLKPYFGMFGYGGPIASMHLGRRALVFSKTEHAKKVYVLHLEREALLSASNSKQWKTHGGIRDPTEDEIRDSHNGSFTKVEIYEHRVKAVDIYKLQCHLKDIYFPYIQSDDISDTRKTITPTTFQVNGVDLAEIQGGEVAITNLHSCNGPEFVLQLHLFLNGGIRSPSSRELQEANARLRCVYFPCREGKENIEKVLDNLKADGCATKEDFRSFSRVSVRRLGRLLPDARWAFLPFMDLRSKKGNRAQLLRKCCMRVKCFIETDGGFQPTLSKTDLAHHSPFTNVLKNLGNKIPDNEKDVEVEIHKDAKRLTHLQLEKEYQDWILQMHDRCDEEADSGEDQPVIIINPANKKALGISSDVIRVHQILKRKDKYWKRGHKIKVLKGACAGVHRTNIYATIEYFLLDGFEGDPGGQARIICRPMEIPNENGCVLSVGDEDASLDIRGCLSLPLSVIDAGKLVALENVDWDDRLNKRQQKNRAAIDLLSSNHCKQLEVDGALPINAPVLAGKVPPKHVVAVVRPADFMHGATEKLDQNYICKSNVDMSMEIRFKNEGQNVEELVHSARASPEFRNGFQGLYLFSLGCKFPTIFHRAGVYTFSFSLMDRSCKSDEMKVIVKPSRSAGKWKRLTSGQNSTLDLRVGSSFPTFSIACYDIYDNRSPFQSSPEMAVKLHTAEDIRFDVHGMKTILSTDKMTLEVRDILVRSDELDKIRPGYGASLVISLSDELLMLSIPCRVNPGFPKCVELHPQITENQLLPGFVFKELKLEMFDAYRNHVLEGSEVALAVAGFKILDHVGMMHKVDNEGTIDLSGLLKVTAGYGEKVSISVLFDNKTIFKQDYSTVRRNLRIASGVPVMKMPKAKDSVGQPLTLYKNLQYSPSFNQEKSLMISIADYENMKLEAIFRVAKQIGHYEDQLEKLIDQKAETESDLLKLQEKVEPYQLSDMNCISTKDELMTRIESMENSSAAVLCNLSRHQQPQKCFMEDIIGLVACIGTVQNPRLSRILAEYLGEDKMLAVICRSFDAACCLERHKQNGAVDLECALHAEAAALGKAISKRFHVLCLEEIRPYMGYIRGNGSQRKLALPVPCLSNGRTPAGFLDHAVNMIDLDVNHLQTRTFSGHGLRETVLFSLFKKLHVYETRESMVAARTCIEDGAVSLDGGILRENGIISLGYGNPFIYFPCGSPVVLPPETREIITQIEEKKSVLRIIEEGNGKFTKALEKSMKKLEKRKRQYYKLMDSLDTKLLEFASDKGDNSSTSGRLR